MSCNALSGLQCCACHKVAPRRALRIASAWSRRCNLFVRRRADRRRQPCSGNRAGARNATLRRVPAGVAALWAMGASLPLGGGLGPWKPRARLAALYRGSLGLQQRLGLVLGRRPGRGGMGLGYVSLWTLGLRCRRGMGVDTRATNGDQPSCNGVTVQIMSAGRRCRRTKWIVDYRDRADVWSFCRARDFGAPLLTARDHRPQRISGFLPRDRSAERNRPVARPSAFRRQSGNPCLPYCRCHWPAATHLRGATAHPRRHWASAETRRSWERSSCKRCAMAARTAISVRRQACVRRRKPLRLRVAASRFGHSPPASAAASVTNPPLAAQGRGRNSRSRWRSNARRQQPAKAG